MTTENKAKAQYTFDTIATHLLVQGQRSEARFPDLDGGMLNGCAYRGNNGLRCAVGFCISNEKYSPELEGKICSNPYVLNAIDAQYCNDGFFLSALQQIHDGDSRMPDTHCVKAWPDKLRKFASRYNLDASIVDTLEAATIPHPQILEETHA